MKQKIVIDGYNMIHQVPGLARELDTSLEAAREALVRKLRAYLSHKKVNAVVVFDGTGLRLPYPTLSKTSNLRVLFSRPPATADSVIKELVSADAHRKSILVVSADRSIVHHASSTEARTLSPRQFYEIMTRRPTSNDVDSKFDRDITDEEVAEWMTLFGETSPGPKNE